MRGSELFSQEAVARRSASGRNVSFDFKVGERPSKYRPENTVEVMVVLSVSYDLGGPNYFSGGYTKRGYGAAIKVEEVERDEKLGMVSRSFTMFKGLGLKRSGEVARFNRKQLEAFADEALSFLREVADSDQVQAQVDEALAKCQQEVAV